MLSALISIAAVLIAQDGPPPAEYRTEVPACALNVIAGAPTSTSVCLSLLAAKSSDYRLTVGMAAPMLGKLVAGEPKPVEVRDLEPGKSYSYVLEASDARVEGRFTTARRAGTSFVFDIQADSHLDGNTDTAVYARTLANEASDHPDFVVDLGDTFMVDKYQDYTQSLKQYQAQRYWLSRIGQDSSVFLCLGNHDGETGWVQRGQTELTPWARTQRQKYFPVISANSFYSGAPKEGLYYSWTWGDALFVVLDPFLATTRKPRNEGEGWNWTLGQTQFSWLEKTLKQSNAPYKFVFIHHLVGGFGKEARGGVEAADRFEWGDEKEFPQQRTGWAEPIHNLMKRTHVSAMFHGHDHLYVRQQRDGITYLEVPQPSAERGDNTISAEEYGYKTGTLLGSSGHIRVTVRPSGALVEYVKSRRDDERNREVVDKFEIKGNAR